MNDQENKIEPGQSTLEWIPPTTTGDTVQIERPVTNSRFDIVVRPIYDSSQSQVLTGKPPEGSEGDYWGIFILSIPGKEVYKSHLNDAELFASGDSLIQVSTGVRKVKLSVLGEQGQNIVYFSPNSNGMLARAETKIHALDLNDAESKAYNLIMPLLSWWSFHHDVALEVSSYAIIEVKTNIKKLQVGLIGKIKPISKNPEFSANEEIRNLFAAYREGLNSTNLFYQILCFYKVIEGVKKVRDDRRRVAKAANSHYSNPLGEKIPDKLEDIREQDSRYIVLFEPYLGRKFTNVLESYRELIRNAIAHLDPGGNSLVIDKFDDINMCQQALPVIRYISRIMLTNEIEVHPTHPKI